MKTTAAVFALLSIALLALVLAGFGALPASIALLAFVASLAGLALLSSQSVEIQIVEEISIVNAGRIAPRTSRAVASAFVALSAVSAPVASKPIVIRETTGWAVEFAGIVRKCATRAEAYSLAYELENGRGIVGGRL